MIFNPNQRHRLLKCITETQILRLIDMIPPTCSTSYLSRVSIRHRPWRACSNSIFCKTTPTTIQACISHFKFNTIKGYSVIISIIWACLPHSNINLAIFKIFKMEMTLITSNNSRIWEIIYHSFKGRLLEDMGQTKWTMFCKMLCKITNRPENLSVILKL